MTSSSAVLRGLRSANLSLRPGEGQTVNVKLSAASWRLWTMSRRSSGCALQSGTSNVRPFT
ncbi:hypothetical protein CHLRE_08g359133v5 [Chlamydomonas reinhardtii]|uniref:Uncharacterized protein n=1 Tax=Chlamydomonas reinhardtii TaxID=3055 RepID=A0A2K3DGC3_CHLRE|nr:uncharacterized protein CHLRE_08g359133v5 [Chlamydomonas reinhardtii]PNW79590.1 hypothetical protein CHLRE_08g359133v5 [Chlamydomonas reinhardtii]